MFVCVHTPKNCDDLDACTLDSCDAGSGDCVNAPKPCDDGNVCTDDACDLAGSCVYFPTNCDDGNACTNDYCADGCKYDLVPCDDDNECTAQECVPESGCEFTVIETCFDGDPCTSDYCHPLTGDCSNKSIGGCSTTTTMPLAECGDANADESINAGDALVVLRSSVGTGGCDPCVCDVNSSGSVTAGDALIVLRIAVDQPVVPSCPDC